MNEYTVPRIYIQLSIFKQKKNDGKQKIPWTIQYNWIMHVPDSRSDCSRSLALLCVFRFAFIRRVSPVTFEIRFSQTRQQNMMSYEIQCTVDYSVFIRNFSYRFSRAFYLLHSSRSYVVHQTVSFHYLSECRMLHCLWRLTLGVRQKKKSKNGKNGFFPENGVSFVFEFIEPHRFVLQRTKWAWKTRALKFMKSFWGVFFPKRYNCFGRMFRVEALNDFSIGQCY